MALRKLAGPFPMKDLDGNYARFFKKPTWFDELMAMPAVCIISKPTGDSHQPGMLVQLDGTVCPRNNALSNYDVFCHDMEGTGIAVTNSYAFGLATRGVNQVSLIAEGAAVANPLQIYQGAYFLPDRTLALNGVTLYGRAYGASGYGTAEVNIPGGLPANGLGTDYSPGPEQGQVFVSGVSGAVLYDHNARQIISWRRTFSPSAFFSLMYSKRLGVWVAIHEVNTPATHHTITVYADEPVPSTLSAPVALGTIGEGSAVEYRTRLLGASSEPCEGVLVDWSVTAPGTLLTAQSTTDANGYATTRVALPPGSEGSSFNLTAEVLE